MDKAAITPELVSRLVAAQFPRWASLPVRPVEADGWDNATFRLGEEMSVRLPSGVGYAAQVDKEHRWLPALAALDGEIGTPRAAEVWEQALSATWRGAPVWVHGDVSPTNLLVDGGRLSSVIDFGCCAVGDPACDTGIAWTFLSGRSRRTFIAGLPVDDATWVRGRGWVLWKSMIVLVDALKDDPEDARYTKQVIDEVLADAAGQEV